MCNRICSGFCLALAGLFYFSKTLCYGLFSKTLCYGGFDRINPGIENARHKKRE